MKPRVLILRTAGTNCDRETEFAFQKAGAQTELYHINYIKDKKSLVDYQIICIPGGFSYGDDLGAGKILSWEFSIWFKDEIKKFIEKDGLILGICNGFQVLVKTGIIPDLDFKQKVTLTFNDSQRFEDRWVYLKVQSSKCNPDRIIGAVPDRIIGAGRDSPRKYRGKSGQVGISSNSYNKVLKMQNVKLEVPNIWWKDLPEVISLPVAHGEGKFYAEPKILDKIERYSHVILRYVDNKGNLAGYPYNPNGSLRNIAGITDFSGRILGLMPHPERFIFQHHYPYWQKEECTPWGIKIFENAVEYFK